MAITYQFYSSNAIINRAQLIVQYDNFLSITMKLRQSLHRSLFPSHNEAAYYHVIKRLEEYDRQLLDAVQILQNS